MQCEINPFAQKILRYYWPKAELFGDITKTDFTKYEGKIDILTGGFPCQPYSVAGKRAGTADDRHLWPHMLRAVREIRPRWVVGENVRGLVSWNEGLVFDEVQSDLEAEGYKVIPFLLPACAVNAPHKRERIWFVAYKSSPRLERPAGAELPQQSRRPTGCSHEGVTENTLRDGRRSDLGQSEPRIGEQRNTGTGDNVRVPADDGPGLRNEGYGVRESGQFGEAGTGNYWQNFPTQPPVCGGNDGVSYRLDASAVFGKPCKPSHAKTFPKWRNESIKGYGNAVVPQVVYQIFQAIEDYELMYC